MENIRLEIVKEVISNENRLALNGDVDNILMVAKKIAYFVEFGEIQQNTQPKTTKDN